MLEKPEIFGEVTQVDGDSVKKWKVESFGDWRDFYANVRDAILGKAALQVTPEQALRVMAGLELVGESSERRCSVAWREAAV
jgi:scyllo-inositol 2-dehydrogenase (NADP+)